MAERTCSVDGCDRKHVAKGLCSSHYNHSRYTPERRHAKYERTCETCGTEYRTYRKDGRFCSLLCRDVGIRGPRFCLLPVPKPKRKRPEREPFEPEMRLCHWCGAGFVAHRGPARFCSKRCQVKDKRTRRRGRQAGSPTGYTWTEVMRVFIGFGKCCAYCEQPIDGQPDPDHVVPLSKGGSNSITNILPCCSPCNSDKRDLLLDEWAADRARRGLPAVVTTWDDADPRVQHLTCLPMAA